MSLPIQADNLIKVGILHQEGHSADEIEECLQLADSYLQVAKANQFDTKVRYLNGYEAVFQVATAGLRALDLRPSQKQGSRTQTIQSLAWTLAVDARLMPVLIQANADRNETTYRRNALAPLGRQELDALIKAADTILKTARKKLLPGASSKPRHS